MLAAATIVVSGGAIAATAGTASAVSCTTGQVTYAASSNTLKLTSGEIDLTDLPKLCAAAPLVPVAGTPKSYELKANLQVLNGAKLHIRGDGADGVTGENAVNYLRLMSAPTNESANVVSIEAAYGTLSFDHTHVTSWDDTTGGPDTDYTLAAGQTAGQGTGKYEARAFVRAVSSFATGTTTPQESRMDIADSEFSYLGFSNTTSYGVSFKGDGGCSATNLGPCDLLNVYGSERNSHFHHNFMGTYTYNMGGHENTSSDALFDGNEYDHNVMYGLDPHDDSDYLTITKNHFHDNGDHGLICSQRCDHLTITGNESDHNGFPPYIAPGDPTASDNQIHGIMIHRGVRDSTIKDNNVHDNNGAGFAVFDSFNNTFDHNTLTNNKYGIRTSVGSYGNTYTNNTVTKSSSYAVYAYSSTTDSAVYGKASGRPTDEKFTGNTFDTTGAELVKLGTSDGFTFSDNIVTGTVGKVSADSSTGLSWTGDAVPGTGLTLKAATSASTATVSYPNGPFVVTPGPSGTIKVTAKGGRLADTSGKTPLATITAGSSDATATYTFDTALLGTSSSSTVTPRPVTVLPASGSLQARISGYTSTTKHLILQGLTVGGTASASWGGLTPGSTWKVTLDTGTPATYTADSNGTITWTHTETTGAAHDYSITAG
jgi:parallel beta-helix repeat protein